MQLVTSDSEFSRLGLWLSLKGQYDLLRYSHAARCRGEYGHFLAGKSVFILPAQVNATSLAWERHT